MRSYLKLALFIFLILPCGSFAYGVGNQESKSGDTATTKSGDAVKTESDVATGNKSSAVEGTIAGEKAFFITDFEDSEMYTRTYAGPVSKINFVFSTE